MLPAICIEIRGQGRSVDIQRHVEAAAPASQPEVEQFVKEGAISPNLARKATQVHVRSASPRLVRDSHVHGAADLVHLLDPELAAVLDKIFQV